MHLLASSLIRSRIAWASLAGLVALAVLMLWRSYPWPLALTLGGAIGVLVFFTLDVVRRLRREFFGPRD